MRLKFSRDFTRPILDSQGEPTGRTRTWPAGWQGVVEGSDAEDAVKDGAAEDVGGAGQAPGGGGSSQPLVVAIPADWDKMNAEDLKNLAKSLGAGDDVDTKAKAADYVQLEVSRRASAQ